MTTDELLDALSWRPLCLKCLAELSIALEGGVVLALLAAAGDLESRVDTCAGCRSITRMTFRFDRVRQQAA